MMFAAVAGHCVREGVRPTGATPHHGNRWR